MPKYRLVRPYFNRVLHEKGAILEFEEGKAPKGSILVTGEEKEPEVAEEATTPELEFQPDLLGLDSDMDTLSKIAADKKK